MKIRILCGLLVVFSCLCIQICGKNRGIETKQGDSFISASMQAMAHLDKFNDLVKMSTPAEAGMKISNVRIYNAIVDKLHDSTASSLINENDIILDKTGKTIKGCYSDLRSNTAPGSTGEAPAGQFIINLIDLIFEGINDKGFAEKANSLIKAKVKISYKIPFHQRCEKSGKEMSHASQVSVMQLDMPKMDGSTLEKCLNGFLVPFKCTCKTTDLEVAYKNEILESPEYLIFALKRFNSKGEKNKIKVKFPYSWRIKNEDYVLKAFIAHKGDNLARGSYSAYGLDSQNNKWWIYDAGKVESGDEAVVREICKNGIIGKDEMPYILFYEKYETLASIFEFEPQPKPESKPADEPEKPKAEPEQDQLVQKIKGLQESVQKVKDLVADVQSNLEPLKNRLK